MEPYPQTILEFREWFATEQACRDYIAKLRRLWFETMWYVTSQKYGVSALGLQRVLGLGSYHTAWNWLHKLRRALGRPGRDRLSGAVEVDEIFIGGERPGIRGRGAANKTLVVIAAQQTEGGIGRIRLCRVANAAGGRKPRTGGPTNGPTRIGSAYGWLAGIQRVGGVELPAQDPS